ncbi:hypothetical protein BGZ73_003626 [Actinomortierella ambigua]|nr:hypothetical protein BGZ73_003626 [Actinomortierella ambigua]
MLFDHSRPLQQPPQQQQQQSQNMPSFTPSTSPKRIPVMDSDNAPMAASHFPPRRPSSSSASLAMLLNGASDHPALPLTDNTTAVTSKQDDIVVPEGSLHTPTNGSAGDDGAMTAQQTSQHEDRHVPSSMDVDSLATHSPVLLHHHYESQQEQPPQQQQQQHPHPVQSPTLGTGLKRINTLDSQDPHQVPLSQQPAHDEPLATVEPARKKAKTASDKQRQTSSTAGGKNAHGTTGRQQHQRSQQPNGGAGKAGGENDTATLFHKIFADREPGKRKIRLKSMSEIPVDLGIDEDDSDFEDHGADVDGEEDEDMIIPKDDFSEDEAKDYQPTFKTEQDFQAALWSWKDNDPEVCCVCLGRSTEVDNVFVYCDTFDCALCVHQGDPDRMDGISVRDIPERNWNMTCYICPDPDNAALGACVQCDAGQCRKSFHVTCAQAYSLLETVEDPGMADPYFTFCKQHGSANGGEAKLNGWAKWVKRRDTLLKQWQQDQGYQRTKRLLEARRNNTNTSNNNDHGLLPVEDGTGLIELFEDSYSRFKTAREQQIARERSELSRQYSIGYYLGHRIDKSRTRLEVVHQKAEQALVEQRRIEARTRALLSSLLECAAYLESMPPSTDPIEGPLSIDTTLAWYNALPDTSRWKSDIQDIIETIDMTSLEYDSSDSHQSPAQEFGGLDDPQQMGTHKNGGARGKLGRPPKHANRQGYIDHYHQHQHHTSKSKKLQPKPAPASSGDNGEPYHTMVSSRGRPIRREVFSDYGSDMAVYGSDYSPVTAAAQKPVRPVMPCAVCHQLTLPEEKMALERDENGNLSATAIKVLNKMVTYCDSSEEDEESSGEEGESSASHHQHSHSSDLGEALMVLADTAMSMSGSAIGDSGNGGKVKRKSSKSKGGERATVVGGKAKPPGLLTATPSLHGVKPYAKVSKAKSESNGGKKLTSKKAMEASMMTSNGASLSGMATAAAAPIVRGNLRIYPPGPFLSATATSEVVKKKKKVKTEDDADHDMTGAVISPTKANKSAKSTAGTKSAAGKTTGKTAGTASTSATKESAAAGSKIKAKAGTTAASVGKTKKVKVEEDATKPTAASAATAKKTKATTAATTSPKGPKTKSGEKKAAAALTVNTKTGSTGKAAGPASASTLVSPGKATTPTAAKRALAASSASSSTATGTSGAAASAPLSPSVPAKPAIKYAVGQKTIEELNAKADAEIERINNVKFRRLRGRTLAMPDGPATPGAVTGGVDPATMEAIHANGI